MPLLTSVPNSLPYLAHAGPSRQLARAATLEHAMKVQPPADGAFITEFERQLVPSYEDPAAIRLTPLASKPVRALRFEATIDAFVLQAVPGGFEALQLAAADLEAALAEITIERLLAAVRIAGFPYVQFELLRVTPTETSAPPQPPPSHPSPAPVAPSPVNIVKPASHVTFVAISGALSTCIFVLCALGLDRRLRPRERGRLVPPAWRALKLSGASALRMGPLALCNRRRGAGGDARADFAVRATVADPVVNATGPPELHPPMASMHWAPPSPALSGRTLASATTSFPSSRRLSVPSIASLKLGPLHDTPPHPGNAASAKEQQTAPAKVRAATFRSRPAPTRISVRRRPEGGAEAEARLDRWFRRAVGCRGGIEQHSPRAERTSHLPLRYVRDRALLELAAATSTHTQKLDFMPDCSAAQKLVGLDASPPHERACSARSCKGAPVKAAPGRASRHHRHGSAEMKASTEEAASQFASWGSQRLEERLVERLRLTRWLLAAGLGDEAVQGAAESLAHLCVHSVDDLQVRWIDVAPHLATNSRRPLGDRIALCAWLRSNGVAAKDTDASLALLVSAGGIHSLEEMAVSWQAAAPRVRLRNPDLASLIELANPSVTIVSPALTQAPDLVVTAGGPMELSIQSHGGMESPARSIETSRQPSCAQPASNEAAVSPDAMASAADAKAFAAASDEAELATIEAAVDSVDVSPSAAKAGGVVNASGVQDLSNANTQASPRDARHGTDLVGDEISSPPLLSNRQMASLIDRSQLLCNGVALPESAVTQIWAEAPTACTPSLLEDKGPLQDSTEPAINQDTAMISLVQALAQGDLERIEITTRRALRAGFAEQTISDLCNERVRSLREQARERSEAQISLAAAMAANSSTLLEGALAAASAAGVSARAIASASAALQILREAEAARDSATRALHGALASDNLDDILACIARAEEVVVEDEQLMTDAQSAAERLHLTLKRQEEAAASLVSALTLAKTPCAEGEAALAAGLELAASAGLTTPLVDDASVCLVSVRSLLLERQQACDTLTGAMQSNDLSLLGDSLLWATQVGVDERVLEEGIVVRNVLESRKAAEVALLQALESKHVNAVEAALAAASAAGVSARAIASASAALQILREAEAARDSATRALHGALASDNLDDILACIARAEEVVVEDEQLMTDAQSAAERLHLTLKRQEEAAASLVSALTLAKTPCAEGEAALAAGLELAASARLTTPLVDTAAVQLRRVRQHLAAVEAAECVRMATAAEVAAVAREIEEQERVDQARQRVRVARACAEAEAAIAQRRRDARRESEKARAEELRAQQMAATSALRQAVLHTASPQGETTSVFKGIQQRHTHNSSATTTAANPVDRLELPGVVAPNLLESILAAATTGTGRCTVRL